MQLGGKTLLTSRAERAGSGSSLRARTQPELTAEADIRPGFRDVRSNIRRESREGEVGWVEDESDAEIA